MILSSWKSRIGLFESTTARSPTKEVLLRAIRHSLRESDPAILYVGCANMYQRRAMRHFDERFLLRRLRRPDRCLQKSLIREKNRRRVGKVGLCGNSVPRV